MFLAKKPTFPCIEIWNTKRVPNLYYSGGSALTDELETEYGSIICEKTLRYQSIKVDEKTRERLDRLTLLDDSFFRLVMKDRPECITLLITVMLEKHDIDVDEVILQADDHSLEHRSVVFDVLVRDVTGNYYNVEIQNGREGASERRIRVNSAHLDVRMLSKGLSANDIMDSYVIVICDEDYFDKKRTIVEVERYFDDGCAYNDGNHIIYFNTSVMDLRTPEGKLAYDLKCTDPGKMHYNELREAVAAYKNSETGERKMSSVWKEVENEGIEKGIVKGIEKGKSEVARNLLAENLLSDEKIAQVTKLPLEDVMKIKAGLIQA